MPSQPDPVSRTPKPGHAWSCVVLTAVVLLSSLPYLGGLGFYSDDWDTLAGFVLHGARAEVANLLSPDSDTRLRPVQVAYLTATMTAFGGNPLPYHVIAALLLAVATLSVYAAAVTVLRNRRLGFVVALLFSLLPHYSTDRFWTSSQQAVLCLLFAMLGICALLRSGEDARRGSWLWPALAMVCFLLSLTAYEVAIGLIAAAVLFAGWRWCRARAGRQGLRWRDWLALGGVVAVLAAVSAAKLLLQERLSMQHRFLHHLGERMLNMLSMGFQFNFWTYGLQMPLVLWKLARGGALSWGAWLASAGVGVVVAVFLWRRFDLASLPTRMQSLKLIVAGLVLWVLGFALLFAAADSPFATAGLANRVTIAATPGAAVVLAALLGLVASMAGSAPARAKAFAVLVGVAAGANCLAVNGIAHFWVEAAQEQKRILQVVATHASGLPRGSALLLDGVCRYAGPAPVFETNWDATGSAQLLLRDTTLRASVMGRSTMLANSSVQTFMYGEMEQEFAYGKDLYVLHVPSGTLTSLPTREAALRYLGRTSPSRESGCPAARDGEGARVF